LKNPLREQPTPAMFRCKSAICKAPIRARAEARTDRHSGLSAPWLPQDLPQIAGAH
jgi:hypothetical protein